MDVHLSSVGRILQIATRGGCKDVRTVTQLLTTSVTALQFGENVEAAGAYLDSVGEVVARLAPSVESDCLSFWMRQVERAGHEASDLGNNLLPSILCQRSDCTATNLVRAVRVLYKRETPSPVPWSFAFRRGIVLCDNGSMSPGDAAAMLAIAVFAGAVDPAAFQADDLDGVDTAGAQENEDAAADFAHAACRVLDGAPDRAFAAIPGKHAAAVFRLVVGLRDSSPSDYETAYIGLCERLANVVPILDTADFVSVSKCILVDPALLQSSLGRNVAANVHQRNVRDLQPADVADLVRLLYASMARRAVPDQRDCNWLGDAVAATCDRMGKYDVHDMVCYVRALKRTWPAFTVSRLLLTKLTKAINRPNGAFDEHRAREALAWLEATATSGGRVEMDVDMDVNALGEDGGLDEMLHRFSNISLLANAADIRDLADQAEAPNCDTNDDSDATNDVATEGDAGTFDRSTYELVADMFGFDDSPETEDARNEFMVDVARAEQRRLAALQRCATADSAPQSAPPIYLDRTCNVQVVSRGLNSRVAARVPSSAIPGAFADAHCTYGFGFLQFKDAHDPGLFLVGTSNGNNDDARLAKSLAILVDLWLAQDQPELVSFLKFGRKILESFVTKSGVIDRAIHTFPLYNRVCGGKRLPIAENGCHHAEQVILALACEALSNRSKDVQSFHFLVSHPGCNMCVAHCATAGITNYGVKRVSSRFEAIHQFSKNTPFQAAFAALPHGPAFVTDLLTLREAGNATVALLSYGEAGPTCLRKLSS